MNRLVRQGKVQVRNRRVHASQPRFLQGTEKSPVLSRNRPCSVWPASYRTTKNALIFGITGKWPNILTYCSFSAQNIKKVAGMACLSADLSRNPCSRPLTGAIAKQRSGWEPKEVACLAARRSFLKLCVLLPSRACRPAAFSPCRRIARLLLTDKTRSAVPGLALRLRRNASGAMLSDTASQPPS